MSEGLEALKRIENQYNELGLRFGETGWHINEEDYFSIKDELIEGNRTKRAFEIIKNKQVDVALFVKTKSVTEYNGLRVMMFRKQAERDYRGVLLKYGLTKEEYDILGEELL